MSVKSVILAMVAVIAMVLPAESEAQMPIKVYSRLQLPPDSADINYYGKEHFWRAAGEVFGFNIGLWAFDRYVQHGDWAYINFNTIKENFKHGFKWDNDNLNTNMFLHPYNGSLYYNAARANGFNYWKSGLFSIAGSAMWELFMECEYPSTNDIIATPIGGMCIGEVCFRASDLVLDDRVGGAERVGREISGFLLSPMRGVTRLITGDAWRRRPTSGKLFGLPNIAVELSLGTRMLDYRHDESHVKFGAAMELNVEYGDRFELKSKKPYDYFTFNASLNFMKTQPVLSHLEIKGRLIGRELLEDKDCHLSIGLFQHFDFFDSDTISSGLVPYKLGIPASLGGGVFYRDIERRRWVFDAYAHANAVILGSVLSDYYMVDDRNYNLASGFSLKGGANMVFDNDRYSFSLSHEYYRLFTWQGYHRNTNLEDADYKTLNAQGDKSVASFNVTQFRADMKLCKRLYLTLLLDHYLRSTHYRDFPHVKSTTLSAKLMLTYKL
ncbi:MAG: DUF3943 domain-containing protein [Bacteroides sp.]|nr:DUF3943 domain-containing protein [Bacteroides sp.]MCM1389032.1 DUF3943 domain-containing protein [Bacteroides sp.]